MLLTYQYRLQPTSDQAATLSHWGELLRRHWNYALGQRFEIKQATIASKADGWYVSFSVKDNTVPSPVPVDEIKSGCGIDVGLEKFLTTSSGEAVAVPQFYRKSQSVLARQQRKLARQEKGSNNYQKQANRVARLHLHIARQRKDFHYSVAHYLCTTYDLIGFERLNIKGLAKTRLAKSILDVAWGAFLNILQAVVVKRGKHVCEVDARGTSIECFNCGERVVKDLSVRVHNCPNCSVSLDRDLNASLNIFKRTVGQPLAASTTRILVTSWCLTAISKS